MEKKVLIVDDSPSIRYIVQMAFQDAGYTVICATDGLDALNKLNDQRISLIISDSNMPHMTGMELLKAVKNKSETAVIPFMMLTTETDKNLVKTAQDLGATAWMVKPFTPERLVEMAIKILNG
ncbi:response regulator [Marinobacter sp. NSM]|uniref:response regulator n=1 Tax=Marinobacter sp. NSM TaxID=3458004 RepID=UPI004035B699